MVNTPKKETFAAKWQRIVSIALGFIRHLRLMYLLILFGLAAGLLYYVYTRSVYYTRALVKVHTLGMPIKSIEEVDVKMRYFGRMFLHRSVQEHTATMMGLSAGFTNYETLSDRYLQKVRLRDFDSGTMILETWAYYPAIADLWPKFIVEGYNDYVQQVREGRRTLLNTVFKEEVENLKQLSERQASSALDFSERHNTVEMFIEKRELDQVPADLLRTREHIKTRSTVEKALTNTDLNVEERLAVLSRFEEEYPAIGSLMDPHPSMPPPTLVGRPSPAPGGATTPRSAIVVVPSQVAKSDDWKKLLDQQRQLIAKREDLSQKFLDGHPQMVALNQELQSLNTRLEGELTVLQNRFSLETERLRAQESALEAQLPEFARFQREFDSFERERELFMASHLPAHEGAIELQKKIGEAAYTMNQDRFSVEYLTTVESRLVDPMSPSKKQGLIASLVFGLCLAIGVPLLLERMRSWSSRVDELESVTGLPALGVVTDDPILKETHPSTSSYSGECFRIVRSGILFSAHGQRDTKVILVTSSRPREGKTTIAMRLALAMSQSGSKTILVDADLRRGRIHRSFDIERSPGLSDYLSGRPEATTVDAILHAIDLPEQNLTVIPTGETRNDAPELLESPRSQRLIEELKERFDHIIIDSPPVLGLADCYPLIRLAAGVVFVIRANFTSYAESSAAVQALTTGGAQFFGFVLNRIDLRSPENLYYYYRYQPKYYSAHVYGPENAHS